MGELTPPASRRVTAGEASGPLLGGTLTQLVASLGDAVGVRSAAAGYVLFLEEVGERPYRLDRMVTQLRQAGLLGAGQRRSCSANCRAATSRRASPRRAA